MIACGGGGAPLAAAPAPIGLEDGGAERATSLNLERAEPSEVLSVAEQLLEEPVLVDAMALTALRCMTVTVKEPAAMARREAAEKLFDALRKQGLRIERAPAMRAWTVKVDEARRPAPCGEGRATAASEAPDAGQSDADAVLQEVLRSIREISPTEHVVTRRALDLFVENQGLLMRAARIVPEEVGGKVAGIRLFGVRPDGMLGHLGFENGDRIERFMGKSVASPDQALEAYSKLRTSKVIEIDIVRRGTPMRLTVRVE